jgi:rSAM/selenodomain-associated transferase 2
VEEQVHNISLIVPVFKDVGALKSLLRQIRDISEELEVVVVDGGESAETRKVCGNYGAVWISSPRGRGIQMNRGALECQGEILWFVHADGIIHPDSLVVIERAMSNDATVGGAFSFRLHQRHWYASLLDLGVRLRSRILKLPYGDQAFFVRRPVFEAMGGFQEIPFLEDVEFIRRLHGYGEVTVLSTPIGISSRRWEREGFLYTTIRNWLVTLVYLLGGSPGHLVKWYAPEWKGAVNSENRAEKKYRFRTVRLRKTQ